MSKIPCGLGRWGVNRALDQPSHYIAHSEVQVLLLQINLKVYNAVGLATCSFGPGVLVLSIKFSTCLERCTNFIWHFLFLSYSDSEFGSIVVRLILAALFGFTSTPWSVFSRLYSIHRSTIVLRLRFFHSAHLWNNRVFPLRICPYRNLFSVVTVLLKSSKYAGIERDFNFNKTCFSIQGSTRQLPIKKYNLRN